MQLLSLSYFSLISLKMATKMAAEAEKIMKEKQKELLQDS